MLFTRVKEKDVVPEDDIGLDIRQLEHEIAAAMNEDAKATQPLDPSETVIPEIAEPPEAHADPFPQPAEQEAAADPLLTRQSLLTQKSLAALSAFEEEMRGTGTSLDAISGAISAIAAVQHTATRLLGGMRAIILRANYLEEAHAALLSDNRRQSQQIEQARAYQVQQDFLNESSRRRIEQLTRDCQEMSLELGSAQLETNEAREALAEVERERALLLHELAAKTAAGDRLFREAETLRQKHVRQQVELAEMEHRCQEAERRCEQAAALHKNEAAELSELRFRLETSDKESRRIHNQAELAQTRLEEAQERLMALQADLDELTSRHASTVSRARAENEALRARLEAAARKTIADEDEIVVLKQQLSEALAAAKVLEIQLSGANGRLEADHLIENGHCDDAPHDEVAGKAIRSGRAKSKRQDQTGVEGDAPDAGETVNDATAHDAGQAAETMKG